MGYTVILLYCRKGTDNFDNEFETIAYYYNCVKIFCKKSFIDVLYYIFGSVLYKCSSTLLLGFRFKASKLMLYEKFYVVHFNNGNTDVQ